MNLNEFAPLLLVIVCNIGFHLLSKSILDNSNPFFGLVETYGIACLGSMVLFFVTKNTLFHDEEAGPNI